MITIPYEKIVEKITAASSMTEAEIEEKVKAKLNQLAGLISKEGAAHIIANELGINLLQSEGLIKIKDLLSGMKSIDLLGKVIRKYEIREFSNEKRTGKVGRFLIGDETGTTMIVLWNDKADLLSTVLEENHIKIKKGNVRENNGYTEVHLGEDGELEINPQGVKIETKQPNGGGYGTPTRKKISELKENDQNVEIFATIVQVFDPKFWETDPETGKKVKREDGSQPPANATYGSVLNLFADDGSDNVRVVLWKNQIINLLGKSEQEIVKYKDSPMEFEEVKTDLLGQMVKFIGRVTKNEMFGRLEFVANMVDRNVNPDEEIKNLENNHRNEDTQEKKSESSTTPEVKRTAPVKEEKKTEEQSSSDISKEALKQPKTGVQTDDSQSSDSDDSLDLEEELISLEDLEDID